MPSCPTSPGSLNNRSVLLSNLGRSEEALEASDEAVHLLLPFAEKLPQAFGRRMRIMAAVWTRRLAECDRQPDAETLRRLSPFLAPKDKAEGQAR